MQDSNSFISPEKINIEAAVDHLKYSLLFHESRGLDREAMQAMVKWIRQQQQSNAVIETYFKDQRIGIRAYYRD